MTSRGKAVASIAGAAAVIYGGGLIYDAQRLPHTPFFQGPLGVVLMAAGAFGLFVVARDWIRGG